MSLSVAMRSYERNSSTSSASSSEKQRAWPSIVSALVAAVGSLTVGYAMGYPSSALIDLAELPDGFSIQKGSVESELFAVSDACTCIALYFTIIRRRALTAFMQLICTITSDCACTVYAYGYLKCMHRQSKSCQPAAPTTWGRAHCSRLYMTVLPCTAQDTSQFVQL